MKAFGLSRGEVALVTGALLLPIPLLAATGLNVPLPGIVERAVASLLPGAAVTAEPGATTAAPGSGSQASVTAESAPADDASARGREAARGADDSPSRAVDEGSSESDTPSTGDPPVGGDTPPGNDPGPGAGPANPQTVPTPPDLASPTPDTAADQELPLQVSVGEDGVGVSNDAGASVSVTTTDDGPQVDVGTPPAPPVPALPVP